jgi:hypothetical protein
MSAPTSPGESRDWRNERFEIPLADVQLSRADRERVLAVHHRQDYEAASVFNEAIGAFVETIVPLAEPICRACRELWGDYGCATARAVLLVGIHEREARKGSRRIAELTEALTPRFGVERLRDRGNRTTELRMTIDEYSLLYGGIGVVDAVLSKMRDEFRRWFRDVGDQARARSDKLWALTLDSDRYVYLTQTFDPSAPVIKRPNAPWDEPALPSPAVSDHEGR